MNIRARKTGPTYERRFIMSDQYAEKLPSIIAPADLGDYTIVLPELVPFLPLLKKCSQQDFEASIKNSREFRAEWNGSSLLLDDGIIRARAGNMALTASGGVLQLEQPGSCNKYSLRKMRTLFRIMHDRQKAVLARNLYSLNCYFSLTHTADFLNIRFVSRGGRTILEYYHRPSANAQGHYQWLTNELTVSRELVWSWDDIDRFFHGDVCSVLQENGIQLNWNSTRAVYERMSFQKNSNRIIERYIRIS